MRVLFVVHANTWFAELFRAASFFRNSGVHVRFLFAMVYPQLAGFAGECRRAGIPVHESLNSRLGTVTRIARWLRDRLNRPFFLARVLYHYLGHVICTRAVASFVAEGHIDLVVLGGDLAGYDTAEFIEGARRAGARTMIVPGSMSDGEEQAEVYKDIPAFRVEGSPANQAVARIFPAWKKLHRGRALVRLPGAEIIAKELHGTAPPLPWVSSSGWADAICVESEYMMEYYRRCGIPDNQLKPVGSLANDALGRVFRERAILGQTLRQELNLRDLPILLTAVAPDFFPKGGRPEAEFSTHGEMLGSWFAVLDKVLGFEVVASLHPSASDTLRQVLRRRGVKVAEESILSLIPHASLFVACVSSTIRWALASGVPVVNYDFYRYRYRDFQGAPGVLNVDDRVGFETAVLELTGNPLALRQLRDSIDSKFWGVLDGKAGERLLGLAQDLAGKTRVHPGSAESPHGS